MKRLYDNSVPSVEMNLKLWRLMPMLNTKVVTEHTIILYLQELNAVNIRGKISHNCVKRRNTRFFRLSCLKAILAKYLVIKKCPSPFLGKVFEFVVFKCLPFNPVMNR